MEPCLQFLWLVPLADPLWWQSKKIETVPKLEVGVMKSLIVVVGLFFFSSPEKAIAQVCPGQCVGPQGMYCGFNGDQGHCNEASVRGCRWIPGQVIVYPGQCVGPQGMYCEFNGDRGHCNEASVRGCRWIPRQVICQ
jgi:hypothetical protein